MLLKNRITILAIPALVISAVVIVNTWNIRFNAPRSSSQIIEFTISKDMTLDAVVGDLSYYGFIKDESAFKYALEHSKDNWVGNNNAIKIGDNTIDRETKYLISQNMNAWKLAGVLLNKGEYSPCSNGCPDTNFNPELLPGGDLAPTIQQKYEWVKTYEDCVKTVGHDGGQLSSEQYVQKTGIRKCISPDAREFTQGKNGWSTPVGG